MEGIIATSTGNVRNINWAQGAQPVAEVHNLYTSPPPPESVADDFKRRLEEVFTVPDDYGACEELLAVFASQGNALAARVRKQITSFAPPSHLVTDRERLIAAERIAVNDPALSRVVERIAALEAMEGEGLAKILLTNLINADRSFLKSLTAPHANREALLERRAQVYVGGVGNFLMSAPDALALLERDLNGAQRPFRGHSQTHRTHFEHGVVFKMDREIAPLNPVMETLSGSFIRGWANTPSCPLAPPTAALHFRNVVAGAAVLNEFAQASYQVGFDPNSQGRPTALPADELIDVIELINRLRTIPFGRVREAWSALLKPSPSDMIPVDRDPFFEYMYDWIMTFPDVERPLDFRPASQHPLSQGPRAVSFSDLTDSAARLRYFKDAAFKMDSIDTWRKMMAIFQACPSLMRGEWIGRLLELPATCRHLGSLFPDSRADDVVGVVSGLLLRINGPLFNRAVAASILSRPEDGKLANYVAELVWHEDQIVDLIFWPVDSDLSWGHEVEPVRGGQRSDNVVHASGLYFMPTMMDKPLDGGTLGLIEKLDPSRFVLDWLVDLDKVVQQSLLLRATGRLPNWTPDLALEQEFFVGVHRILGELKRDLQPSWTLRDLFSRISPLVAELYRAIEGGSGGVQAAVRRFYQGFVHGVSLQEVFGEDLERFPEVPGRNVLLRRLQSQVNPAERQYPAALYQFIALLDLNGLYSGPTKDQPKLLSYCERIAQIQSVHTLHVRSEVAQWLLEKGLLTGNPALTRLALRSGANAVHYDDRKRTPFFILLTALENDKLAEEAIRQCAGMLFEAGGRQVNCPSDDGYTPFAKLMQKFYHIPLARAKFVGDLMLSYGANRDPINPPLAGEMRDQDSGLVQGLTPIEEAIQRTIRNNDDRHLETIIILCRRGAGCRVNPAMAYQLLTQFPNYPDLADAINRLSLVNGAFHLEALFRSASARQLPAGVLPGNVLKLLRSDGEYWITEGVDVDGGSLQKKVSILIGDSLLHLVPNVRRVSGPVAVSLLGRILGVPGVSVECVCESNVYGRRRPLMVYSVPVQTAQGLSFHEAHLARQIVFELVVGYAGGAPDDYTTSVNSVRDEKWLQLNRVGLEGAFDTEFRGPSFLLAQSEAALPLHPSVAEWLGSMDPSSLLRDWLLHLGRTAREWNNLFADLVGEVAVLKDKGSNELPPLLELPEGTVDLVRRRLQRVRSIVRSQPSISPIDLAVALDPSFEVQRSLLRSSLTPQGRYNQAEKSWQSNWGQPHVMVPSSQFLPLAGKLLRAENSVVEVLCEVKSRQRRFEALERLALPEELEEVLDQLNWKAITPEDQRRLVDTLVKLPLKCRNLNLAHCQVLTDADLTALVGENCEELDITGCKEVTARGLGRLKAPRLRRLVAIDVCQAASETALTLNMPAVESLQLRSSAILMVNIEGARLVRLSLSLPLLTEITVAAPNLQTLNLSGCEALPFESIRAVIRAHEKLCVVNLEEIPSIGQGSQLSEIDYTRAPLLMTIDQEKVSASVWSLVQGLAAGTLDEFAVPADVSDADLFALAAAIGACPGLKRLHFGVHENRHLFSDQGLNRFLTALSRVTGLKELRLGGNFLVTHNGFESLLALLRSTRSLSTLDLTGQPINTEMGRRLGAALNGLPFLTHFVANRCELTENALQGLLEDLRTDLPLQTLEIRENGFASSSVDTLVRLATTLGQLREIDIRDNVAFGSQACSSLQERLSGRSLTIVDAYHTGEANQPSPFQLNNAVPGQLLQWQCNVIDLLELRYPMLERHRLDSETTQLVEWAEAHLHRSQLNPTMACLPSLKEVVRRLSPQYVGELDEVDMDD